MTIAPLSSSSAPSSRQITSPSYPIPTATNIGPRDIHRLSANTKATKRPSRSLIDRDLKSYPYHIPKEASMGKSASFSFRPSVSLSNPSPSSLSHHQPQHPPQPPLLPPQHQHQHHQHHQQQQQQQQHPYPQHPDPYPRGYSHHPPQPPQQLPPTPSHSHMLHQPSKLQGSQGASHPSEPLMSPRAPSGHFSSQDSKPFVREPNRAYSSSDALATLSLDTTRDRYPSNPNPNSPAMTYPHSPHGTHPNINNSNSNINSRIGDDTHRLQEERQERYPHHQQHHPSHSYFQHHPQHSQPPLQYPHSLHQPPPQQPNIPPQQTRQENERVKGVKREQANQDGAMEDELDQDDPDMRRDDEDEEEDENVDEPMDEGEEEFDQFDRAGHGPGHNKPPSSGNIRDGIKQEPGTTSWGGMAMGMNMNGGTAEEGEEDYYEGPGPGEPSGVNNGSSKKRTTTAKHKCPQCDKYFTRPFNLKSHQRTHTQERPFVCSFAHCARAFSRLHDCNRHMRTHWRIKPYSCPECHRNFVRQDALTRHLRLDFGHNRCSGYPGPVSGSGKDDSPSGSGTESTPVSPVSIKKAPIAIAPAPTSPTSPLDGASGLATSPKSMDDPSGRPFNGPRDNDQTSPVDPIASGPSPMFANRGAPYERAPVSPSSTKEIILGHPPHNRSYSHSGHTRPLQSPTSTTKPSVPLTPTSATFGSNGHLDPDRDRRGSGAPRLSTIVWSGPSTEAYRQPPSYEEPRPHGPPHGPPQDSPDVRRSPPMHPSEWPQDRPDPNKAWNWEQQYERDARHRNPSWPSTPQGPPPGPGYRPPPARSSTLDSWQRSHSYAYESREEFVGRDPRERDDARSRSKYPVSPVALTHEKNAEVYTRPPLATLTRDNYQRSEAMNDRPVEDMEHPPSVAWDHRSRSFQGLETVPESRRRYDDYGPLSPVHPRESPRARDPPPTERSNSYGMVERSQPGWSHSRGPSSFSTKEFDPRAPRPGHGYEAPPRPSRHDSKIVIRERRLSMSPEPSNRSPRAVDGSRFSFVEPQLREGAYPPHRPIGPHDVESGFREDRGHLAEEWNGGQPPHRYPHAQHSGQHHEDRYLPRRERMSVDMPSAPKRSLSIATIPQ